MNGNEENDEDPVKKAPKRKKPESTDHGISVEIATKKGGGSGMLDPFYKKNYTRVYPENNCGLTDYKVFIESTNPNDKLGNKIPVYFNSIFEREIKGVSTIYRMNANKMAVVFKQNIMANNFIKNTSFLTKYSLKAYIPAAQIEKTGIIRFVPTNISNEELYKNDDPT